MSRYQITGIIYIHIRMNKWVKRYTWEFPHKHSMFTAPDEHMPYTRRQHDRKCRLSQVNNYTLIIPRRVIQLYNYYLILGPRDKSAPPTSQQIKQIPPKRVKNPATPSSIFIFIFIPSSSTGELCSQLIRGNVCRIGRMFPELCSAKVFGSRI